MKERPFRSSPGSTGLRMGNGSSDSHKEKKVEPSKGQLDQLGDDVCQSREMLEICEKTTSKA